MKINFQRRRLLGFGATAALLGLSGCSGATPFVGKQLEDTQSYDAESIDTVTVTGRNGKIRVRPTDADRVRVETVKESGSVLTDMDAVQVETTTEDGTLSIETRQTGDGSWLSGVPTVNVTVELPSSVDLDELRTENGSIDVRRVETNAKLVSENGSINAHRLAGFVSAETENGSVTVRDVAGVDGARTENGSIEIDVPAIRGDTTIRNENGGVTAAVSPDVDANLVATNELGSVEVDVSNFDAASRTGSRVEGTLGDGGSDLRFVTENGSVSVSELR